ncbi:BQ2448_3883 [Microbotryum intermedium]|uniref:BQ2448_3883 protein n=1 Tax=Microbotryum intermedium TaxID=269621 RepID=A0A238FMN7_9BASI|nr:BQ2448_3883 [Microbotryum intermedium]
MPTPRYSASPLIRKPSLVRLSASSRRHHASSPSLRLPPIILLPSRTLILLVVFYAEYATFYLHTSSCRFGDTPSSQGKVWRPLAPPLKRADSATEPAASSPSFGDWEDDPRWKGDKPWHVLVISDPQILDMRSYPGRPWIGRYLGIKFTDAYIRKAWRFVRRTSGLHGKIDSVVWLGDLLDSGVESVDVVEHAKYSSRFFRLFPPPSSTLSKSPSTIYVPGNHDLGLHNPSSALSTYGRERFRATFGPTSGIVEAGGWEIVWVDAMALLEPGAEGIEARNRIEQMGEKKSNLPRILFTHIPLYRPEGTFCGASRESHNALRQGSGLNYQNELDEETTQWLVRALKPNLVYSGDDHDSCIVRHPFLVDGEAPLIETTVKAFSMAMGIHRPGYHLLSLYAPKDASNPSTSATFTQTNCVLPDQIFLWTRIYLPLYLLLITLFLAPKLWRLLTGSFKRSSASARSNGLPIHRHGTSLSRQWLGRGLKDDGAYEDEGDDDEAQFPSFSFLATPGDDYAYHSGVGAEELPTSSSPNRSQGHSRRSSVLDDEDEEDEELELGNKVRRVSRVYMWESKGSFMGSGGEGGGGSGGEASSPSPLSHSMGRRQLTSRPNKVALVLMRIDEALNRGLGPIYRCTLKPVLRILRTASKRVWTTPFLVASRVEELLGRTKSGLVCVQTMRQVHAVVWPGVVLWTLVWVWFAI